MRCLRFNLHRDIPAYLDGELDTRKSRQLDAHLRRCGDCALRLERIRGGRSLIKELQRHSPERQHWELIEAALDSQAPRGNAPGANARLRLAASRYAVALLAVAVIALLAVFILRKPPAREIYATKIVGSVDFKDFHPVSISNIGSNKLPHIVAEGYVSDVQASDEGDGDLTFKLVENMGESSPFIYCEIINPINIKPPAVGSRVRVYGVSRYDAEAGHNWYEVHPVLNIEAVRR